METETLNHLKAHLAGRVVIIGVGNTMRSDDGIGSILASRLQGKVPWIVYDAQESPENYLGKIERDDPDTVVIIDAVDFGAAAGTIAILEAEDIKTASMYSTHNASIYMLINYLKTNLKADIIVLVIQPKKISLGDCLSPQINVVLEKLENWFYDTAKKKG